MNLSLQGQYQELVNDLLTSVSMPEYSERAFHEYVNKIQI